MNPRLTILSMSSQMSKIKNLPKKDIRSITSEFLMERFGNRAKMDVGQDYVTVLVDRKNQEPDLYVFEDGKFISRYTNRVVNNVKSFISTHAIEKGFMTKVITKTPEDKTIKTYETIIDTVKKPKKGFLGYIGSDYEKFNLRMRLEKINNDITKSSEKLIKWILELSNNTSKLKAVDDSVRFHAEFLHEKDYANISRINLGFNESQIVKNALEWLDGEFSI